MYSPSCPSPETQQEGCNNQACSVNWAGPDNTSGTPIWEEYPKTRLSGTILSYSTGKTVEQCKQECIDNTACGAITTKEGNTSGTIQPKCVLRGGDAMPSGVTAQLFASYTLSRG